MLALDEPLWKNNLRGAGYSAGISLCLWQAHSSKESALLVGLNGKVLALDPASGERLWDVSLKGTLLSFVAMHLDAPHDRLYVTSNGKVCVMRRQRVRHDDLLTVALSQLFTVALSKREGVVEQREPVAGMGLFTMSMASVEGNTEMNKNPYPHRKQYQRDNKNNN